MKFLGKVLLTLVLIIVAIYMLLQTQWGTGWLARQISAKSDYQLSIGKIEHNFHYPSQLLFDNVSFGRHGQPAILIAQRVNLGLSLQQLRNPLHFASIRLDQGTLDISHHTVPLSLQADQLQLSQMALHRHQDQANGSLQAQRVDGNIIPWQLQTGSFLGKQADFQASVGALTLDGVTAANVLLQGRVNGNELIFSNLSADMALGSVTGSAQRDTQGRWQVSSLQLNSIRLQSDKTLSEFLLPLKSLPDVRIGRIDVTDARLEGRDWAITDLDLALRNITFSHGDWQSHNGSLSVNATSFVNGSLQLDDPTVHLAFSSQGIALSQFSTRWVNGLIRSQGHWRRSDKKLTLNELHIDDLEYTLPENWRDRWMQTLPDWLENMQVTKFTASHNLIIDINPDFPFQMTSLDSTGNNLLLVHNYQWGIWAGSLNVNAAEATFNRVDLRHPSLVLNADDNAIQVTKMSAWSGDGMLEGVASISQQPDRTLSLTLNGRQVAASILHNWGWPLLPLDNGNMQLTAQASLQRDTPLKSTVNATLNITSGEKSVQQRMINGEVK